MNTNASMASVHPGQVAVSPLKPMFGFALLLALGLFGLVIGLGSGLDGSDLTLLTLALCTLAAGFLPLVVDSGLPLERRHVLLSLVSIVYGVSFAVPVLDYYIPAVGPADPPGMSAVNLTNDDIARSQIMGLLGLLLIYASYYGAPVRTVVRQLVPPPRYEWTEGGAVIAACMLIPAGWAFYLAGSLGFLPKRLGSGLIGGIADLALVAPAFLAAIHLRYRSRLSLLLLVVLIPLTSGFNFFTGSKRLTLMPWAVAILTYIVYTRRVQLRWMAAGVLALALLYPAAQFYRHVILKDYTRSFVEVLKNPGPALESVGAFVAGGGGSFLDYLDEGLERTASRIDAVGHPAVILRDTPSVVPFQYGATLAQTVYAFVPRVVWPSKPNIGIGLWINDNYNNSRKLIDSHLGPSWIGEFYLNFATPGIIVGMLLVGVLFRTWHELLAGRHRTIPLIVGEVVVLKDMMFMVTGGIVGIVNAPLVGILPVLGIHVVLRLVGGVRRLDDSELART